MNLILLDAVLLVENSTNCITRAYPNVTIADLDPLEYPEEESYIEVTEIPDDYRPDMYLYIDDTYQLSDNAFQAKYNMTRDEAILLKEMLDTL